VRRRCSIKIAADILLDRGSVCAALPNNAKLPGLPHFAAKHPFDHHPVAASKTLLAGRSKRFGRGADARPRGCDATPMTALGFTARTL